MKRKIIKGRPKPTLTQLGNAANFDEVMAGYNIQKRIQIRRYLAIGGIFVFSAFMAFLFFNEQAPSGILANEEIKSPRPITEVFSKKDSIRISTNDTTRIKTLQGEELIIPPGAFVSGEIDSVLFVYKFFHDWADILLNKVPMKYDSANVTYNLVSDGMVEVRGFANGEELQINENIPIYLSIPISDTTKDYGIYFLEDTSQSWTYMGPEEETKNEIYFSENVDSKEVDITELKTLQSRMGNLKSIREEPPRKRSNSDMAFKIDFDPMDYQEFAGYNEVEFIAAEGLQQDDFEKKWTELQLNRKRGSRNYFVTLRNDAERLQFEAIPVFHGKDFDKAMAAFNERRKVIKHRIDSISVEIERMENLGDSEQLKQGRVLRNNSLRSMEKTKKVRRLQIRAAGYWNFDCPIPISISRANKMTPRFSNIDQGEIPSSRSFLIQSGLRTYLEIDLNNPVLIDSKLDNKLIVITKNDEIFYLDHLQTLPEEEDGTYSFVMSQIKVEGKSSAELKHIMGIR